jgi:hypothetical protein
MKFFYLSLTHGKEGRTIFDIAGGLVIELSLPLIKKFFTLNYHTKALPKPTQCGFLSSPHVFYCIGGDIHGNDVWGTDVYTTSSDPCKAARHAGVIDKGKKK